MGVKPGVVPGSGRGGSGSRANPPREGGGSRVAARLEEREGLKHSARPRSAVPAPEGGAPGTATRRLFDHIPWPARRDPGMQPAGALGSSLKAQLFPRLRDRPERQDNRPGRAGEGSARESCQPDRPGEPTPVWSHGAGATPTAGGYPAPGPSPTWPEGPWAGEGSEFSLRGPLRPWISLLGRPPERPVGCEGAC